MQRQHKPPALAELLIALNPASGTPLYLQLYEQLRELIMARSIAPDSKLPSTRELARALEVSRNTVLAAFEQLLAEGYLEGRLGSGTYVACTLPDSLLNTRTVCRNAMSRRTVAPRLSQRAKAYLSVPITASVMPPNPEEVYAQDRSPLPFRLQDPALDVVPIDTMQRILARSWRDVRPEMLFYGNPAGYRPLREVIANHVQATRSVHCDWRQVIVVNGAMQAWDLVAKVLCEPGDPMIIEDPCNVGVKGAFLGAGLRLHPVAVDDEGLPIELGARIAPEARIVYVTPSHQHPLGMTMSLPRRLQLLDWARSNDGWIIEDDYDSEIRYRGRPISSLQGLDTQSRVIYVGTFSKVLLPSLRLGYMIVPPDLIESFTAARAHTDWSSPILEQLLMTEFIQAGHFAKHIRRIRELYEQRQNSLVEAARVHLGGLMEVRPKAAGMHLIGWLPANVSDREAALAAASVNIDARPVSRHVLQTARPPGLLLGYAALDERTIWAGAQRLAEGLREFLKVAPRRIQKVALAGQKIQP
jgi:GntR family transcriptional regulator/MocR family aminotransferase